MTWANVPPSQPAGSSHAFRSSIENFMSFPFSIRVSGSAFISQYDRSSKLSFDLLWEIFSFLGTFFLGPDSFFSAVVIVGSKEEVGGPRERRARFGTGSSAGASAIRVRLGGMDASVLWRCCWIGGKTTRFCMDVCSPVTEKWSWHRRTTLYMRTPLIATPRSCDDSFFMSLMVK